MVLLCVAYISAIWIFSESITDSWGSFQFLSGVIRLVMGVLFLGPFFGGITVFGGHFSTHAKFKGFYGRLLSDQH